MPCTEKGQRRLRERMVKETNFNRLATCSPENRCLVVSSVVLAVLDILLLIVSVVTGAIMAASNDIDTKTTYATVFSPCCVLFFFFLAILVPCCWCETPCIEGPPAPVAPAQPPPVELPDVVVEDNNEQHQEREPEPEPQQDPKPEPKPEPKLESEPAAAAQTTTSSLTISDTLTGTEEKGAVELKDASTFKVEGTPTTQQVDMGPQQLDPSAQELEVESTPKVK